MSEIKARMEVIGSCGKHVGRVDAVEDEVTIRLQRDGAENVHHYIPLDWVQSVGQTVRLNKTHDEVVTQWHDKPFAKSGEAVKREDPTAM